jgi:hypothetical protein
MPFANCQQEVYAQAQQLYPDIPDLETGNFTLQDIPKFTRRNGNSGSHSLQLRQSAPPEVSNPPSMFPTSFNKICSKVTSAGPFQDNHGATHGKYQPGTASKLSPTLVAIAADHPGQEAVSRQSARTTQLSGFAMM